MTTLDPIQVAAMSKDLPLLVTESQRDWECVLCGAIQDEGSWQVKLAKRLPACPGCATDAGWTVR
jgi:hypothetical protein